ncbi:Uncharacterised protein [Bordetella trematum]|uniref:Phage protein n=1 Tax=Bordetella trematum TaxID=123899 RepID=A0A157KXX8_9BORD|nr:hypothetical protein [Bordetella trematum]NNH18672.1 hypothetical protein [Bordetella trematum]SAH88859.1 Uncharacterised protein [Bordetella trematum]SAI66561.1 Uncharacterised protein [Bordetella trematum]SUV96548.1 Uncharacterised protein [Bordetella trematum]
MTTVHDLLMICPDDQITRMQIVWKAVAAGQWKEAAHHLRNAENEGESSWHDRCGMLADEFDSKVEVCAA